MKRTTAAIFVLLIGLPGALSASSLLDTSIGSATYEAAWAGRVDVLDKRVVKRSGFHFTIFEVKLQEIFKGSGQEGTIAEVEVPGGEFRGKVIQVTGAPMMRPGDEVVLFLDRQPVPKNQQARAMQAGSFRSAITHWKAFEVLDQRGEKIVVPMGSANLLRRTQNGYSALSAHGGRFREERYNDFVGKIFDSLD